MAAIAAGLFGYLTSFIIARFRHLALIMITLGFGLGAAGGRQQRRLDHWRLRRLARRPYLADFRPNSVSICGATPPTVTRSPVLFLIFLISRRLIHSPFGLALRGIRENGQRMPAIGAPTPPAYPDRLHHRRHHCRHRRRHADANHRNRVARGFGLSALRRRAGDARSSAAPAGFMAALSAPRST